MLSNWIKWIPIADLPNEINLKQLIQSDFGLTIRFKGKNNKNVTVSFEVLFYLIELLMKVTCLRRYSNYKRVF